MNINLSDPNGVYIRADDSPLAFAVTSVDLDMTKRRVTIPVPKGHFLPSNLKSLHVILKGINVTLENLRCSSFYTSKGMGTCSYVFEEDLEFGVLYDYWHGLRVTPDERKKIAAEVKQRLEREHQSIQDQVRSRMRQDSIRKALCVYLVANTFKTVYTGDAIRSVIKRHPEYDDKEIQQEINRMLLDNLAEGKENSRLSSVSLAPVHKKIVSLLRLADSCSMNKAVLQNTVTDLLCISAIQKSPPIKDAIKDAIMDLIDVSVVSASTPPVICLTDSIRKCL